jgi:hypothetical protein
MNERTIFEKAMDLKDPETRAAYIEQACGEDEALKARVEALLGSHEDPGSFLEGL